MGRPPLAERAALKARIGVRKLNVEAVRVMDAAMRPVPADGATLGRSCCAAIR